MTEIRKITLQFPSLRAFLAEYGARISADGMLLREEAPPDAGSTVDIEVIVGEDMRLLRARGETLWRGATGGGSQDDTAAVRFQEMDAASRTLIGKIVDQRRRAGARPFRLADVPGPRQAPLRDLTVPAAAAFAASAAPAKAAGDSIFDLAEAPAASREPVAPVPLLADLEAAPFDLEQGMELEPHATGPEEEVAVAGLQLEPAPEAVDAEPGPAAGPDLTELFGSDEPEMAPPRGRTEPFPPSFVDEVEAELEATEVPESAEGPPESPAAPAAELAPSPLPEIVRAFDGERGSETGEIPIQTPPPLVPDAAEPLLAEDLLPPAAEALPPAAEVSPPATEEPPPAEATLQVEQASADLLSVPELSETPAAAAVPSAPAVEMPEPAPEAQLLSSAEALRGAASRPRHLGTWLLIALLAGALAVAGYFLLGLVRGDGGETEREIEAGGLDPATAPAPAAEEGPADIAPPPTAVDEAPPEPATAGSPAAGMEDQAGVAGPEPAAPEAARPLTGLNRITWSESDSATVLALIGDGEIQRRQVEVVPIAGGQPRLVIKISEVRRAFQPAVLEVGTSHVQRVRAGLHAGSELHVVIDLTAADVSVLDLAIRGSRLEVRLGAE